ncbi:hypothetical protein [Hoeflea sp. TYP-13]|uniref:hypothetical protein n=1 Tax=Hoeflea sp. TYP-13 TaxID=3230023 RepID=UPI0034C6BB6E
MHIISKRDGPRREDVKAKRLIQQNWGTIEKLADQISGGSYSASKVKKPEPKPEGLIINVPASKRTADEPDPHLRISNNGRVIIMDLKSGLQLDFLGQIGRRDNKVVFILATRKNGFISPLKDELYDQLHDLEGAAITTEFSENDLLEELKKRLDLA